MIDDRLCPDCAEDWHCGGCACCVAERDDDGQPTLFGTGELETRPMPDPHQAAHDARLRWQPRGIEVVDDPQGRIA